MSVEEIKNFFRKKTVLEYKPGQDFIPNINISLNMEYFERTKTQKQGQREREYSNTKVEVFQTPKRFIDAFSRQEDWISNGNYHAK